jgi:plasmid maintenance system antidote protein VapI
MSDDQQVISGDEARVLSVPPSVRAAWFGARPDLTPGQLWRARWEDVSVFVVVLRTEGSSVDVAPVSLDVELATDSAVLLEPGETDFDVPVAVWLELRAAVPERVLEQYAGTVHLAVDALRKAPQGRPVLTPLDDRAMEVAVLGDDMDELAAAPAHDATLQELLAPVGLQQLVELGVPTQLALALSRGLRPLTPELAAKIAPVAGVTPETLLRANPPLSADVVRDLDSTEGRELVSRLASHRGVPEADARLMAGYGAYALAARETGRGDVDWTARIAAYVTAVLDDE